MKNVLFLLISILIISCVQERNKEVKQEKTETSSIPENKTITEQKSIEQEEKISEFKKTPPPIKEDNPMIPFEKRMFKKDSDRKDLLGYYVGRFEALDYGDVHKKNGSYTNKITISIDHIKNDSLYGHSVVAGNARPFKGTIRYNKKIFVDVIEPGDDEYDGAFDFTFYPEKSKLMGAWTANDSNLAVPKREYTLTKREFKYDTNLNLSFDVDHDYNLPLFNSQNQENGEMEAISANIVGRLNASTQELTNKDIENLNKGELEVLRNLIYARHGYSFKNRKMRYFFDSQIDWYIPVSTDIRNQLTDLEKKNIDLIKRYEQHAKKYYDYFGR